MRILVLGCGLILVASASAEETKFPYTAYVVTDELYVRSGPGQTYYPTDKLTRGQAVEVYRHDPGGWLAIRPVEGSFCWVHARYLEPKGDGLAEVTADGVSCRIGSRLSDVRDIIGVRLKKGEIVELLDENQLRRGDGWCRISPPAGDFRWVYGKYVSPDYPHNGLSKPPSGVRAEDAPTPVPPNPPSNNAASSGVGVSATGVAPVGTSRAEDFRAAIESLDLELAIVVAEEPALWNLEPLRRRAEELLERAPGPVERGHVRVLLGKIERFEGIRQRYQSIEFARDEAERARRLLSGVGQGTINTTGTIATAPPGLASAPIGTLSTTNIGASERFDGMGRLAELRSSRLGAPRYVLVNERGKILYYVSPAPGVNLRHYLGKQVGVTGTREFLSERNATMLIAKHITPLENDRIR